MGLVNLLRVDSKCVSCKEEIDLLFQFKYGSHQSSYFYLGAQISWGGPQVLDGEPDVGKVEVEAIAYPCPRCKGQAIIPKYQLIVIENDVLVEIKPNMGQRPINQEGSYWVLE